MVDSGVVRMTKKCPYGECGYTSDSEKGIAVHHAKVHGKSIAKDEKICEVCGDEFETYIDSRSCGRECAGDIISQVKMTEGHIVECPNCNTEKRVPDWIYEKYTENGNYFYCDMECKIEYMTGRTQEESHGWMGGYDEFYGDNWSEMKRRVLDRDNHSCRVCGDGVEKLGKEPDVHHITPKREFDVVEESNTMDNLISLCSVHHGKVEGGAIECPEVNNE